MEPTNRYADKIKPESFHVVSPRDERDWMAAPPPEDLALPSRWGMVKSAPILNQGKEGFCTIYGLIATLMHSAPAAMKFKEHFTNELCNSIARRQMHFSTLEWVKSLFRPEIWRYKGYNLRAALWNLSRGYTYNGFSMKISQYYRCRIKTPLDMCKYLYHYGPIYSAVAYTERGQQPWGFRYDPLGGKLLGHCVCFTGYDLAKKEIYFPNSWGDEWGNKGFGKIHFDDFGVNWENWHIPTQGIDFHVDSGV